MLKNRIHLLLLVIVLVLITAVPASANSPDANFRVRIVDFAFRPRTVMGNVGDTVRWRNAGAASHTSTSTTGVWDSGTLAPGATFSRTFDAAGTFKYTCTFHPFMQAKVVVSP